MDEHDEGEHFQSFHPQQHINDSLDDIQEIIMQAQKAFNKKDALKRQQMGSADRFTEGNSPQSTDEEPVIAPAQSMSSRDKRPRGKSSNNSRSPKTMFGGTTKPLVRSTGIRNSEQQQKGKTRNNVMLSNQNSDGGLYVDTNLEAADPEQERTYTPEPFKQDSHEGQHFRNLKKGLGDNRNSFLPPINDRSKDSSFDRQTGNFNSKERNGYGEIMSNPKEKIKVMQTQFDDDYSESRAVTDRESLSKSQMNLYRKQRIEKQISKERGAKSNEPSQRQNNERIFEKRSSLRSSQNSSVTRFSKNLSLLYDKITEIYPAFEKVASSKSLNPSLGHEDLLRAENVFNQLNFMYQRAIQQQKQKTKQEDEIYQNMEEQNNQMKYQLETTEREITYYSNQLEQFKEQLENAAVREQQTEINYEKRLQYLNDQVAKYEVRVDSMQHRLDQHQVQKDGNLSFRDNSRERTHNSRERTHKSPARGVENTFYQHTSEQTDKKMSIDVDMRITQLTQELKDLKTKFKSKEETIGFERDQNQHLKDKLEKMNDAFKNEMLSYKKEANLLRDEVSEKSQQVASYRRQVDEIAACASLEFPIVLQIPTIQTLPVGINLINQISAGSVKDSTKFLSMKGATKKSPILQELELDLDEIMNKKPFGRPEDDEVKLAPISHLNKLHKPQVRRKSAGRPGKSPMQRQNVQPSGVEGMFHLNDSLKSQMGAILVADEVLNDMKNQKKELSVKLAQKYESNKEAMQKLEDFKKEKDEQASKLQTLTKDNEGLKLKFSQLLDQFQEYVNESERKMEEEQAQQKNEQNKLLSDLNGTIKELDEMSKGLQQDVDQKQRHIDQLQADNEQINQQVNLLQSENKELSCNGESSSVQLKGLTEENKYLKQHYLMEMEALRAENVNLHTRMRERSSEIMNNRRYQNQRSASPYEGGEELGQAQSMHMGGKYEDSVVEQQIDYNFPGGDLRMSRQRSQLCVQDSHQMRAKGGVEVSNRKETANSREDFRRFRDQEQEIQDIMYGKDGKAVRSRSYDRALGGTDTRNAHARGSSQDMHASIAYEERKRDLLDKDRLIEQKNKEIVKLRIDNDELRSSLEGNGTSPPVRMQQRLLIVTEIEDTVEQLRMELERTKMNLFKQEGRQTHSPLNFRERMGYEVLASEEMLLSVLSEKSQALRSLASLANEIYLLSGQNKFSPQRSQQHRFQASPSRVGMMTISELEYQKLLHENSNLQQSVQQYEQNLAQLDLAGQSPEHHQNLIELQRMSQNQLHQIMQLQQENAMMQDQISQQENFGLTNNSQLLKMQQESRFLKQEVQMLRECEQRAQNLKDGNDELMAERRQLLSQIERHEQVQSDVNMQGQDHQLQVADRDAQLEELRSRITVIAELFEKKSIKQRYSFEVLCDFVHDKAKRLFSKYEKAVKEKKEALADDKNGRKVFRLEQEALAMNEAVGLVKSYLLPQMLNLLSKEGHQEDISSLDIQFIRQLMSELDFEFKRQRKEIMDNGQTIQSNLQKIEQLQTALDHKPTEQRPGGYSGYSPSKPPATEEQLRVVRLEKDQLAQKLDEFSHVLHEFQANQRGYEQENQSLRQKISQLEGQKSTGDIYSQKPNQLNVLLNSLANDQTLSASNGFSAHNHRGENLLQLTSHGTQNYNQTSMSGQTTPAQQYIGGVNAITYDRDSPKLQD